MRKRSGFPLSTELTGESDEYLYFTSEVPGYASFVITGNTTQEVLEEESDQVPPSESRSTDGFQLGGISQKKPGLIRTEIPY